MQAINTGKCLKDPKRMAHSQNQLYLKSPDEMVEVFGGKNMQAVVSTLEVADLCTAELQFGKTQLPSIEVPKEFDGKKILDDMDYLEALARKGLVERGRSGDKKYEDRLNEELSVIRSLREKGLRFDRYFLVVWDYVNWAWANGIRVGAGRGSGAGSLVLYCLRITGIDPLPYDLLFERFLTPDRNEMPDIDIDFDNERGGEVYDYVCRRFGIERCARVGTISTFHVASALKAAFKIFDPGNTWERQVAAKEFSEQQRKNGVRSKQKDSIHDETKRIAEEINKMLPVGQNGGPSDKCTLLKEKAAANDQLIYVYDEVPAIREKKKQYPEVFALAEKIEGLVNNRSIHAAGVLITEDPLVDVVPQQFAGKGQQMATAFPMDDCEKLGCIKFDFLRTKALSVITRTINAVKKRYGVDIDIDNLVPDDKKALDIFKRGDTIAIFQFESDGMQKMLKDLRPDCFEDVIAANAIYRPGPIENIGMYCKRKHGEEAIVYPVKLLESVLKPTYGVMVYQEQVMKITNVLANFNGSEADKVRKAMGKKKKDILDAQAEKFFKGIAKHQTCDLDVAKHLWQQMEKFGEYAFNKSHAAAYAYTAYQCAYLKAHYPAEFMAAQLTVEGADSKYDAVKMYEDAADDMGFRVLPPDINAAYPDYTVQDMPNGKKAIVKGFKGVSGLGDQVYADIMNARKERKFKDMYDYCFRAGAGAKNDVFTTLFDAGAFNEWKDKDSYLSKKLGHKATGYDIEAEYNEMSKRAQNEKKEKGARKEEKDGIGVIFAIEEDDKPAAQEEFRL
jgi:DNA polymerase-3 subunit alpha